MRAAVCSESPSASLSVFRTNDAHSWEFRTWLTRAARRSPVEATKPVSQLRVMRTAPHCTLERTADYTEKKHSTYLSPQSAQL